MYDKKMLRPLEFLLFRHLQRSLPSERIRGFKNNRMHYHGRSRTSINPLTEYQFSVIEWCEHTMRYTFSVFFFTLPALDHPYHHHDVPGIHCVNGSIYAFSVYSLYLNIYICIYFYSYPKIYLIRGYQNR